MLTTLVHAVVIATAVTWHPAPDVSAVPHLASQATTSADIVFVDANVITMSEPRRASAIAITGDEIVAVGADTDVERFVSASTQVIDLDGATVLPGLVDAHSHFFEEGLRTGLGARIQDSEILSNGITTTAEFHVGPAMVEQMYAIEAAGELRVRTSLYLTYTDACGERQGDWWRAHPPTRAPGELLRIGGIKVFADGGACNVPAVSYTYPDGSDGDLYFDIDELEAIIREVDATGHQVAVHALGDRAVATVLTAMDRVIGDTGNPRRHRIEHSAVVGPDLYGRHDQAGVVAVLSGAYRTCFLTDDSSDYRYRTPDEFMSWEWAWRQLLDTNPATTFAWHADYPALPASIGATLAGFVTRVEGDCRPTPAMVEGVVTVDEALEMMTLGSAYALGRDGEVGSLEVSKFADLVVLSQDPTAIDPLALESTEVLMTMVGGRVEFCRDPGAAICAGPAPDVAAASTGGAPEACSASDTNLAAGASVTASASLPDRPPEHAVDGDSDTGWGAGAGPEQWIEIDLGRTRDLTCVRLLVDQYPAGATLHRINGGAHPDPGAELGVVEASTESGAWIELAGSWPVRYLRVTTVASPSWVAWYEIEAR